MAKKHETQDWSNYAVKLRFFKHKTSNQLHSQYEILRALDDGTIEPQVELDLSVWEEITKKQYDSLRAAQEQARQEYESRPDVIARKEIAQLKSQLAATDYQAIKHSEGWITEEEYSEIKAQRQAWRDRINELEEQLNG